MMSSYLENKEKEFEGKEKKLERYRKVLNYGKYVPLVLYFVYRFESLTIILFNFSLWTIIWYSAISFLFSILIIDILISVIIRRKFINTQIKIQGLMFILNLSLYLYLLTPLF